MASTGARVLMARSVEFGRRYNVPIIVKPTFSEGVGTTVKEKVMEQAIVSGVTHNDKEIKVYTYLVYPINQVLLVVFLATFQKKG